MAQEAICFLLEQVNDVIKVHKDLISDQEKDVFLHLVGDLDLLRAFLHDAPSRSRKRRLFQEMERQIKEVVHEVEDTIDVCLAVAAASKGRTLLRLLNRKRVSLGMQIKAIRQDKLMPMFEKAKKDFSNIQPAAGGPDPDDEDWFVRKAQVIRQELVVGFDDEERSIIKYLMEGKEKLDVISIIGMPGLGKTTLAWKVYQNPDVCYEFPIRIWVHVTKIFDSRKVFLNILRYFTSEDMHEMSDVELGTRVRQSLEGRKFLLALDGVWSIEVWDTLKDVLSHSNGMSKVLITTRKVGVGRHVGEAHVLTFRSSNQSWELLQLELFGNLEDCPPELETIGRRIADQCQGVPLQIVMIAGILRDQLARNSRSSFLVVEGWEYVSENMSVYLQNKMKENSAMDIIGLSYYGLPYYMRECFLYLAVFPKDYEIPVRTLIRLWIAEGFILPQEGKKLEDTALEYLNDLVNQNLLMVASKNQTGDAKRCRIHIMIHAFCKSKAWELNLYQEIKFSNEVFEPPISEIQTFRRISLSNSVPLNTFLEENPKGPQVRSLLCFNGDSVLLEPQYSSSIYEGFNLLRVFESKAMKFVQFPESIAKMIHLRYLTLCIEDLQVLPESISKLWNLQTLVVETETCTIEIKANIWRMIQLRHLKTKAALILQEPIRKGRESTADKLQTITALSPDSCTPAFSQKALYLKTLGIRGKLATFFESMSLHELRQLQKLKLVNDDSSSDQIQSFPLPHSFPPNLKRLTLSKTYLNWDHMATLAQIGTLEILKLKDNAFTGPSWNAVGVGFRRLVFLLIVNTDLRHWEADPDHLPTLRFLMLKECQQLEEIPQCLANNLEKLEIDCVSKSVTDSAKKLRKLANNKIINGEPNLSSSSVLVVYDHQQSTIEQSS